MPLHGRGLLAGTAAKSSGRLEGRFLGRQVCLLLGNLVGRARALGPLANVEFARLSRPGEVSDVAAGVSENGPEVRPEDPDYIRMGAAFSFLKCFSRL